jgi:hypothetical protein
MYWLLIVQLFVNAEWIPAVYEDTQTPVTHIYRTHSQCLEESVAYNVSRSSPVERAICVAIK